MEKIIYQIEVWAKGVNSQFIYLYTKDTLVAAHYSKTADTKVRAFDADLIKDIPVKFVEYKDLELLSDAQGGKEEVILNHGGKYPHAEAVLDML